MNVQKSFKSRFCGTSFFLLYSVLHTQSFMYKLTIAIALLFTLYSCSHKTQAQKETAAGNTIQWYAFADNQRYNNPSDVYQLSDSMIRLYGNKVGYLMSTTSYGDFELTLQYRWNMEAQYQRGTGKKNSGVMYNVPDTAHDALWPAGIQFQVKEGATGDFILLENVTLTVRNETRAPGKSIAVARLSEQEKPLGEWNTIRIRSQKGHCWQYLNDQLVNEGTNASSQAGRILLQYEGSPIDFRKIDLHAIK